MSFLVWFGMAVSYLIVHGVLFAEILAVLRQHLREHYVTFIPGEKKMANSKNLM
jgi:hypothetical protein